MQGQPADVTAVSTWPKRWTGPCGDSGPLQSAPLGGAGGPLQLKSIWQQPLLGTCPPGCRQRQAQMLGHPALPRKKWDISPPRVCIGHSPLRLKGPSLHPVSSDHTSQLPCGILVHLRICNVTCLLFRLLLPVLAIHWNLSPEVYTHFQLVNMCPLHFQGRVWELSLRMEKKKIKRKKRKWEPHAKGKSEQIAMKLNCLFVWIECYKFLSIMFDSKLSSKQQTHYKNAKGI